MYRKHQLPYCPCYQLKPKHCKFAGWKDRKLFCKYLNKIYTAINRQVALGGLLVFKHTWQFKYKYTIDSRKEIWDTLTNYIDYPLEPGKKIHTTNTPENLTREIRKYIKTTSPFNNETAVTKPVFLSIQIIEKSQAGSIQNRVITLHQYLTIFQSRCRL